MHNQKTSFCHYAYQSRCLSHVSTPIFLLDHGPNDLIMTFTKYFYNDKLELIGCIKVACLILYCILFIVIIIRSIKRRKRWWSHHIQPQLQLLKGEKPSLIFSNVHRRRLEYKGFRIINHQRNTDRCGNSLSIPREC